MWVVLRSAEREESASMTWACRRVTGAEEEERQTFKPQPATCSPSPHPPHTNDVAACVIL